MKMAKFLIYIYNDYGSNEFSVKQLEASLRKLYASSSRVEMISGKEIQCGRLVEGRGDGVPPLNRTILCIGGGFDLGYLQTLGQLGCECIRSFIYEGGNYLGICAGAYFASRMVKFDVSGPLEVIGERKLGFFEGSAIGPINKNFKYNCEDEALAVKVQFSDEILKTYNLYVNGGCFFEEDSGNDLLNKSHFVSVLGRYLDKKDDTNSVGRRINELDGKVAILERTLGKGGKVLLSGVHFEFDARTLDLKNENIKTNVFAKLNSNENNKELHSNEKLIKFLLKKVFSLE